MADMGNLLCYETSNPLIIRYTDGVFEIASYIVCISLMDRIGRRLLLTVMLLLAGIGLIASVIVNEYAGKNQSRFLNVLEIFFLV